MSEQLTGLFAEKVGSAIEQHFGSFTNRPRIQLTPNLYKRHGAWGQTTYLKTTNEPVLIEIDQDLFNTNTNEGRTTVVHEMLEWRAIEKGEPFPHQFAEQNQDKILAVGMLRPVDLFLHQHPILSLLIRGY